MRPRAAAQSGPRRRLRRHALRADVRPAVVDSSVVGRSFAPVTCARRAGPLALLRQDDRRNQPGLSRACSGDGGRLFRAAGAADLSVLPRNDGRRETRSKCSTRWTSISRRVLHGEQKLRLSRAGRGRRHADVPVDGHRRHDKKGGALTFVDVDDQGRPTRRGEHVADATRVDRRAKLRRPAMTTQLDLADGRRPLSSTRRLPPISRTTLALYRRRLGRPQSDAHRHRLRQEGRHSRRVRARHARHGLSRPGA